MKKKWREIKILFGICAAFGWWGALYPELMLLPDTYRVVIVEEDCSGEILPDKNSSSKIATKKEKAYKVEKYADDWRITEEMYQDILEAEGDRIVIKSKLWEDINTLIEEWRNGK